MPTLAQLTAELHVVTGPFAYVRPLRDRKAVDDLTEKIDCIVIDRSEQIEGSLPFSCPLPHVMVASTDSGHATATCLQSFRAVLDQPLLNKTRAVRRRGRTAPIFRRSHGSYPYRRPAD